MKTIDIRHFILCAIFLLAAGCKDDISAPLDAAMECDRTEIAAGDVVCFVDRSQGSPARWDWIFEGGEPATSQLSSPEVVYNSPGTYSVTLRVGRGGENSEKVYSQFITVAYPYEVSADFEADVVNAYNTDIVTFTDRSTGFPTTWDWTFTSAEGTVVKSTEQNPAMTFEPGLYTVTLKVKNPNAESSVTKEDYLNVIDKDAVAAEFEVSGSRMILAGGEVTFKDMTMGSPTSWKWEFEGADTPVSTDRNPKIRYSKAGRYKVKLTAANSINTSVCEKEGHIMVIPSQNLSMWIPCDGSLKDFSPKANISVKEYVSDPSKWKVELNAPSRHGDGASALLGGACKTNTDDYAVLQVENPDQLPGGMQSTTFILWVKADGKDGSRMGLFNRGRPAGAITHDTADKNQSQEWARLNTTSSSSEGCVRWYVNTTDQGSACAANTTKNLLDNQWHCIAFVKEVSGGDCVIKVYSDGELDVTSAKQQAKDTYKDPFFIGCTEQFTKTKDHQINNPFNGCLDDIMMFDKAMTAEEVKTLYEILK